MNPISLLQNGRSFLIRELEFHEASTFEDEGLLYSTDESLLGALEDDVEPDPGAAELRYRGQTYPVTVAVVHFEALPGDESEEPAENEIDEGVIIEITPENIELRDFAAQLGLIQAEEQVD